MPGAARPQAESASPMPARSWVSVVFATVQPWLTPPSTLACGTRALSMKTSLKTASPVISRSGRTSTPGWRIGNRKYVMPWCFGRSGSVRAMRMP